MPASFFEHPILNSPYAAPSRHHVLDADGQPTDATRTPRRVMIGTMHQAKGLEFKAAGIIACDDGILPLQSRLASVADEMELDDVYETERQLFYVACTRARDRLLITSVRPSSEFLSDLRT